MPFISYAQNFEDVILWRVLNDIENGFYVDVGAADPTEYSVTRAFYDRGWSGINIEPQDDYSARLTRERPRDINLKVAVGREAGTRTMYAFDGTGLSTFDRSIRERQESRGFHGHEITVPVLPLTDILDNYQPQTIHFLKIDVEGAEAEVLESLDLSRIRPWILVIEATEPSSMVNTKESWEHLVTGRGYGFAYFDGLNCFYVADEVGELKRKIGVPVNVFDEFQRYSEVEKDKRIATLNHELRTENERAVIEKDKRIATLNHELRTENERAVRFEKEINELTIRLHMHEAHIQDLNERACQQFIALSEQLQRLEAEAKMSIYYRFYRDVRATGDRLTGGGLRALAKRTLSGAAQCASERPHLLRLLRFLLKPFPDLSTKICSLTNEPTVERKPTSSLQEKNAPLFSENGSASASSSTNTVLQRLRIAQHQNNHWRRER